ncbi:winged helix-turn-helix transcriptional regulator [Leptothoe spongobia]|uniref:winged helix-turn-helix transcriptional regulator n=1 Tax=Leptothoe spongobia TaxID=2651728 RepID=UPI001FEA8141|nr:winged helix-turn-helix transcriptional regulator [Leptothoe spongobia]
MVLTSTHIFVSNGDLSRVEYELTEFGRSLEAILVLMQEWGSAFKARRLAEELEDV